MECEPLYRIHTSNFYTVTNQNLTCILSGDETSLVSDPSLPSTPLTIPLSDLSSTVAGVPSSTNETTDLQQLLDPAWRPDFELQYIELEEVGRGRFSVVRRCQEILTGREVAVKFVNR